MTAAFARPSASPTYERIAGFIHIGRTTAAVEDRPRPPLGQIVTNFPEEI